MGIQSLMQRGADNRSSYLEKTADTLLYFPGAMWRDSRRVKVIEVEGKMEIQDQLYDPRESFTSFSIGLLRTNYLDSFAAGPAIVVLTACYIALSILATPFLAVGAIMKKVSLINEEEAEAYNKLSYEASITNKLELEKLELEAEKSNLADKIEKLGVSNLPEEPVEFRTRRDSEIHALRKKIFQENKYLQQQKSKIEIRIEQLNKKLASQQQITQQLFDKYIKLKSS